MSEAAAGGIEIRPLTAAIGAELRGLDLRRPLESRSVARIERALLDHLVLFFRGQQLTTDQLFAFGTRFGSVSLPPISPAHPEHPQLMLLDQTEPKGTGADSWHVDAPWLPEPPGATVLMAIQVPASGGDTCFASMYAAYEALSPPLRDLVDGLRGVHDLTAPLRKARAKGISRDELEGMRRRWPPIAHPLVRTHPRSGRRALFAPSNSVTHIEGLAPAESDRLLRFLFQHVRAPEFQCRLRWEPYSIAFWDQRCTQHYGIPDYAERRVMVRLSIDGERPE